MLREYLVYVMTNRSGTLYVGMTNNLVARVDQHKNALARSFTGRYKLNRLVYFESTPEVTVAIQREKQIKGWTRQKKIALIASLKPRWADLSSDWYENGEQPGNPAGSLDSSAAASE